MRDEHKQENYSRKEGDGEENLALHTAIHGELLESMSDMTIWTVETSISPISEADV